MTCLCISIKTYLFIFIYIKIILYIKHKNQEIIQTIDYLNHKEVISPSILGVDSGRVRSGIGLKM